MSTLKKVGLWVLFLLAFPFAIVVALLRGRALGKVLGAAEEKRDETLREIHDADSAALTRMLRSRARQRD